LAYFVYNFIATLPLHLHEKSKVWAATGPNGKATAAAARNETLPVRRASGPAV